MNHKIVRHILVDNSGDLSTKLVFSFEIGRVNANYIFFIWCTFLGWGCNAKWSKAAWEMEMRTSR